MLSQPTAASAAAPADGRPTALRHLLIPGAALLPGADATGAPHGTQPPQPPLPNLQALLARLRPADTILCDEESPESPIALALARARGLPGQPGRHAWAALDTGTVGAPCAWLRPAHLQMGMDDVQLIALDQLQLSDDEARQLLAACAPLLSEDGITLHAVAPGRWLARGELLRHLYTPAPDCAAGRRLTRHELLRADQPEQQRLLARVLSELEMVLATHPISQAREAARRWPVNSVWVHGAGALDAPVPPTPGVRVAPQLTQGEAPVDPAANTVAWQAIDQGEAADLLASLRSGQPVQLTLGGPRSAVTLAAPSGGLWGRISSLFGRPTLQDLRKQL